MRILVTGGTGLIGTRLLPRLVRGGHRVSLVTRNPARLAAQDGVEPVQGDPTQPGPWLDRVRECDAVVHLAGEPIFARRWSRRFKQAIRDSRVQSTTLISGELARHPRTAAGSPRVFVSGSGIGYYGSRLDDEECDENTPPGADFLGQVSVEWEGATRPAQDAGCRTVILRTGIVLDPSGGALKTMARPFRFFVGGVIGSGRQWMSWIHVEDEVELIAFCLENPRVQGPVNAVAPEPVKNWGFCKTLGKVLRRPCWLPTPGWVVRLAVGEAAQLVTRGQRVAPRAAEGFGYRFRFPQLEPALRELYG